MTSRNKMRKAKNSYCANALKFGNSKLKREFFYDATQRKRSKKVNKVYKRFVEE